MMKRFNYGAAASPLDPESVDSCFEGEIPVYDAEGVFTHCTDNPVLDALLLGDVIYAAPILGTPNPDEYECAEDEAISWDGSRGEYVCMEKKPVETKIPLKPKLKVDRKIKEQVKKAVKKEEEKDKKLAWWQLSIIGVGALTVVGLIAQAINRRTR